MGKSQPDEGRSCCQVCRLCESRASLMKEVCRLRESRASLRKEIVIKEYRLRESRASLRKEIVIRACRLRESRASLRKKELLSKSVGCVPSRPASSNKSVSVKISLKIQCHIQFSQIIWKSKSKRWNQKSTQSIKASEPSSWGSPPPEEMNQ